MNIVIEVTPSPPRAEPVAKVNYMYFLRRISVVYAYQIVAVLFGGSPEHRQHIKQLACPHNRFVPAYLFLNFRTSIQFIAKKEKERH